MLQISCETSNFFFARSKQSGFTGFVFSVNLNLQYLWINFKNELLKMTFFLTFSWYVNFLSFETHTLRLSTSRGKTYFTTFKLYVRLSKLLKLLGPEVKVLTRFWQISSNWIGSNWIKSDQVGSSWCKIIQIGPNWIKWDYFDQIGS